MDVDSAMAQLQALAEPAMFKQNAKRGAGHNQFGVRVGKIRALAKQIKTQPELSRELWATGNIDAQLLAILLTSPKKLSAEDLDEMAQTVGFHWVSDWFAAYLVKKHKDKESLRERWMNSESPWIARLGWSLTAERVAKSPEGLDLSALLDRIEAEMPGADEAQQWTMNMALVEIGIHHEALRQRAVDLGEALGIYSDWPVQKGCTPPFAPVWIAEMVKRQG